jgi:hypothetical protein
MKSAALALCVALWAPYQCATDPNERPVEDTAPKALWLLSERFQADGDQKARETTLRQLAEQYPSSRYAQRARGELGMADPSPDEAPPSQEQGDDELGEQASGKD